MKIRALFVFALSICLFQTAFGQEISATTQTQRGYLLGPGDVIEGKVLGEEEFNFVSTVDEDGKIQVPFFDEGIVAKCKTEKDLRVDVAKLLSKYLRNPQISVRVTERKSRPPAVVSGEVKLPSRVDLPRTTRLLELINFSNGLTKDASGMIEVFHTQPPVCTDAEEATFWKTEMENSRDVPSKLYSFSQLQLGKDESNPIIYPGDLVYVRKAQPVYVIGEVMVLKEISIGENGLSLMEAIAQAGGLSREAKKKEITIQRVNPNSKDKKEFIKVNYDLIRKGEKNDVMLQPNDIIVVDKTKKSIAQTILEIATGSITQFSNVLPQRVLY
jgi:polysaccharide export outer membrane protein